MSGTNADRQSPTSRHFIDLTTSLYFAGQPAMGILRVEREIASRLLKNPLLTAIPVVFWSDRMFILEPDDADLILHDRPLTPPVVDHGLTSFGIFNRIRMHLGRMRQRLIRIAPRHARDDIRWAAFFVRRTLRALFRRQANPPVAFPNRRAIDGAAPLPDIRNEIRKRLSVVARPDRQDVLWTCGHLPLVPLRQIAELKRSNGFHVAAMGYDLIRLHYPEWNPPNAPRDLFVADIVDLIDTADLIYCISRHTWRGLSGFATETGRNRLRLKLVRLGADLPAEKAVPVAAAATETLLRSFGKRLALAVGTIEARKNYGLLITIWERLSETPDFDLNLVIVGRAGDDGAFIEEIRASPLFGTKLFWIEHCPDHVLSELYERCLCLLCPSLMEGWGLPVTEALARGKPVLSSNRGALPEAAMGAATLLDPTDPSAWTNAIRSFARNPPSPGPSVPMPSWDTAAERICRGLLRLSTRAAS